MNVACYSQAFRVIASHFDLDRLNFDVPISEGTSCSKQREESAVAVQGEFSEELVVAAVAKYILVVECQSELQS